jgi:DNA-directed RNA polymerase specialized sigma24 family protein
MSPSAALMLEKQIYPIIRNTIPRTARPIGCEDHEELVQDATASAAEMIESMEKSGRAPLPHSIAYYSIQRTKSGRRSYGARRLDVMSAGFRMDHEGSVCSMQDPVCDENDSNVGDTIASKSEDMATKVLRQIDWSEFLETLDARKRRIVEEMMFGFGTGDLARLLAISATRIVQLKREIGQKIKEFMGDNILVDAGQESVWERDIRCLREKGEWKHMKIDRVDDDLEYMHVAQEMFG